MPDVTYEAPRSVNSPPSPSISETLRTARFLRLPRFVLGFCAYHAWVPGMRVAYPWHTRERCHVCRACATIAMRMARMAWHAWHTRMPRIACHTCHARMPRMPCAVPLGRACCTTANMIQTICGSQHLERFKTDTATHQLTRRTDVTAAARDMVCNVCNVCNVWSFRLARAQVLRDVPTRANFP